MAMNIKNFFNTGFFQASNNDSPYVKSSKRTSATSIDLFVVMFVRIVVAEIMGRLWVNDAMAKMMTDFSEHFGTDTIKNTPEHIQFIGSHPSFLQMIFLCFVLWLIGLLYHSILNSSSWQATIGKRLVGIMVTSEDNRNGRMSFLGGVAHYILSILPIIYMLYILGLVSNQHITLFRAITFSEMNIFFGFCAIIWIQIHLFTAKKQTVYDMVCKAVFVKGRTSAKFPWSKI